MLVRPTQIYCSYLRSVVALLRATTVRMGTVLTWGHTQELGTFDSPMLCTTAIAAMSGTCKADVS
jgi:hypothetical protein